jgi:two-component system sensor histidine kinase HydH
MPHQADPDRLNQVLLNLYLNAMQAIGRDGVIRYRQAKRRRVKIVVADSGKGMSGGELQAIFTPYFTTKADGTGLGLAVVQNIIEQHGGTIRAESAPARERYLRFLPVNGQQRMNKDEQR